MGFLTDPKTKKRMTPEAFIKRETIEWYEALGIFAKEVVGGKPKSKEHILILGGDRLGRQLNSAHDFKKRR